LRILRRPEGRSREETREGTANRAATVHSGVPLPRNASGTQQWALLRMQRRRW